MNRPDPLDDQIEDIARRIARIVATTEERLCRVTIGAAPEQQAAAIERLGQCLSEVGIDLVDIDVEAEPDGVRLVRTVFEPF